MMTTIGDLKEGDFAAIDSGGSFTLTRIVWLTPTQIVTRGERRWRRSDGKEMGGLSRLVVPTNDIRRMVLEARLAKTLYNAKWSNLPPRVAAAIYNLAQPYLFSNLKPIDVDSFWPTSPAQPDASARVPSE